MTENKIFPGRLNYTGPNNGMGGFVHHGELVEYCYSFKERIAYIKSNKPKNEVATRLHNLIYIDPVDCPAVTKLVVALDSDYDDELAPLDAEILTYIKSQIPDCAWNGETLVFPAE